MIKPKYVSLLIFLTIFLVINQLFLAHALITEVTPPVIAQSNSSLSSELFSLRTRVNQLEAQVRRLNQSISRSNNNTNNNIPVYPSRDNPTFVESIDPMFQRLATLVIELKERINVLEAKVANLEQGDKGDKGDKLGR